MKKGSEEMATAVFEPIIEKTTLTPVTKRIIIVGIIATGMGIVLGTAFGKITWDQAAVPLSGIMTGLFALVNGDK